MFEKIIGLLIVGLMFPLILAYAEEDYKFVQKWGTSGTNDGEFSYPKPIGIDDNDNIYVLDNTGRIQKFDSNGTFITTLIGANPLSIVDGSLDPNGNLYLIKYVGLRHSEPYLTSVVKKFNSDGEFIKEWGTPGTNQSEFNEPLEISVDSTGNVYVGDSWNHRIQKFDNNGTFITEWGSNGSKPGQFNLIHGLDIDTLGNVFVADAGYVFDNRDRIQKFDSNGTFITEWGSQGNKSGQFNHPMDLAIDSKGNVYVADSHNSRIQKFDSNGTFITEWGSACFALETNVSKYADPKLRCADPDGNGPLEKGDGQFDMPLGIAIDSNDNIYVGDYNHRIQKFMSNTTSLQQ